MNILIVDDEEIIVQGLMKHISKLQSLHTVLVGASSGAEALCAMEHFRPDLMITDLHMNGMSGLELIAQVRSRNLCPNIMILSAYEEFEYARRALDLNVMSYLVKPIDLDELDARLMQLCRQQHLREQADAVLKRYEVCFSHMLHTNFSPTLRKITRYVQKNYYQDLSLSRLSRQAGLTQSYICTLFKKELDCTFLDFVNELRLHQAMRTLIESPRTSVRDVAAQVGYRSERQLFRLFNVRLSMTPQQFRELNGDRQE